MSAAPRPASLGFGRSQRLQPNGRVGSRRPCRRAARPCAARGGRTGSGRPAPRSSAVAAAAEDHRQHPPAGVHDRSARVSRPATRRATSCHETPAQRRGKLRRLRPPTSMMPCSRIGRRADPRRADRMPALREAQRRAARRPGPRAAHDRQRADAPRLGTRSRATSLTRIEPDRAWPHGARPVPPDPDDHGLAAAATWAFVATMPSRAIQPLPLPAPQSAGHLDLHDAAVRAHHLRVARRRRRRRAGSAAPALDVDADELRSVRIGPCGGAGGTRRPSTASSLPTISESSIGSRSEEICSEGAAEQPRGAAAMPARQERSADRVDDDACGPAGGAAGGRAARPRPPDTTEQQRGRQRQDEREVVVVAAVEHAAVRAPRRRRSGGEARERQRAGEPGPDAPGHDRREQAPTIRSTVGMRAASLRQPGDAGARPGTVLGSRHATSFHPLWTGIERSAAGKSP